MNEIQTLRWECARLLSGLYSGTALMTKAKELSGFIMTGEIPKEPEPHLVESAEKEAA